MGHITIDENIKAPVETVFAYVDDYRNTTKYMKDLSKWQPTGSVTHGKGAQFAVGMKAGPTTLTSVVDITTWAENRAIGWVSREGFKQTGKWAFKDAFLKARPALPRTALPPDLTLAAGKRRLDGDPFEALMPR